MANTDVKLKHKVQLRKKVEDPEVTVETGGAETGGNTPMLPKPNSNNWIWIILGIIAICIICYFIFSKSANTAADTESTREIEIVEESIVPTDSVSDKEDATGEVLPATEDEVSNKDDDQNAKVSEGSTTDNKLNKDTTITRTVNSANVSNDVEAEAMKVIRGDYGIGQERKDKLGPKYQTIQSRVNELKREGIF